MSTEALSWPASLPRPSWKAPPPMGQGLAVIAVVAVALLVSGIGVGAYLVSFRIASARAQAVRLDRRLAERRAELRGLAREYEIRSRMGELDRWRAPLDLQAVGLGQTVAQGEQVATAASARQQVLAVADAKAHPVDAPAHPGYPQAARSSLDDLIGAITN